MTDCLTITSSWSFENASGLVKYPDAVKQETMTHQQALATPSIQVMDRAALGMAADGSMPIVIFKLDKDTIRDVVSGEPTGTRVSAG